jgi:hypothetical protein
MGGWAAPLDRWIMPRGNRGIVLPHARRVCRLADRRDITSNSNHGRAAITPIASVQGEPAFFAHVARQSERPQPRGLFTHGQTVCLVFGRCFLTVQQPLLLFLENRFGSIACLMSVDIQRRYSFAGESTPQDRASWGPDAICRFADVGLVN